MPYPVYVARTSGKQRDEQKKKALEQVRMEQFAGEALQPPSSRHLGLAHAALAQAVERGSEISRANDPNVNPHAFPWSASSADAHDALIGQRTTNISLVAWQAKLREVAVAIAKPAFQSPMTTSARSAPS